jgi:hypothetical protein
MSLIVEVAGPIGRCTDAPHFTHEPFSYQASSELPPTPVPPRRAGVTEPPHSGQPAVDHRRTVAVLCVHLLPDADV